MSKKKSQDLLSLENRLKTIIREIYAETYSNGVSGLEQTSYKNTDGIGCFVLSKRAGTSSVGPDEEKYLSFDNSDDFINQLLGPETRANFPKEHEKNKENLPEQHFIQGWKKRKDFVLLKMSSLITKFDESMFKQIDVRRLIEAMNYEGSPKTTLESELPNGKLSRGWFEYPDYKKNKKSILLLSGLAYFLKHKSYGEEVRKLLKAIVKPSVERFRKQLEEVLEEADDMKAVSQEAQYFCKACLEFLPVDNISEFLTAKSSVQRFMINPESYLEKDMNKWLDIFQWKKFPDVDNDMQERFCFLVVLLEKIKNNKPVIIQGREKKISENINKKAILFLDEAVKYFHAKEGESLSSIDVENFQGCIEQNKQNKRYIDLFSALGNCIDQVTDTVNKRFALLADQGDKKASVYAAIDEGALGKDAPTLISISNEIAKTRQKLRDNNATEEEAKEIYLKIADEEKGSLVTCLEKLSPKPTKTKQPSAKPTNIMELDWFIGLLAKVKSQLNKIKRKLFPKEENHARRIQAKTKSQLRKIGLFAQKRPREEDDQSAVKRPRHS
jgi:hypothetical protein